MRFHVLAVPHTVTDETYSACAFTQKVLKFCAMMHARGHEVIHYGHERSKAECSEHVTVMTDDVLKKAYGAYDWRSEQFKHDTNDAAHLYFNMRASEEVAKRKQRGDFLLMFWGLGHAHVGKCHANDMIVVEPGIGSYNKVVAPFSIFESYAVMHHIYAKFAMMPRFMDAVVPNYFRESDFIDASDPETRDARIKDFDTASDTMKRILACPEGYMVLIGRVVPTKGIQLAIEVAAAANVKLVIAGQGPLSGAVSPKTVIDETEASDPSGVTYIGYVEPKERAVLLARAKCLIAPSLYAEPFGGVNVEAQMSGIPVVSTDWGAFAETVVHGKTGYRCRTLDHFVWAVNNVGDLDRKYIRARAVANYGFAKVGSMYEEYFSMISTTLTAKGFYSTNTGRLGLKWLEKE